MNKKLVKTRIDRTNTLEAMACNCIRECDCRNCSGGGSWSSKEDTGRRDTRRKELHAKVY